VFSLLYFPTGCSRRGLLLRSPSEAAFLRFFFLSISFCIFAPKFRHSTAHNMTPLRCAFTTRQSALCSSFLDCFGRDDSLTHSTRWPCNCLVTARKKEKRRNEDDDEKVDLDRFKGFTHNVAS
jgi:hypothetical protein